MTMTETQPADAGEAGASSGQATRSSGLAALLGSGDHLAIARLWIVASFLFLVVAGVAGGLLGVERLDVSSLDLLDDTGSQVFSLHAVGGIFLFLVPAFIGIATAVVPAQVGAATIAFPRAAAAAFWGWFLSSGVLIGSYFADGGPGGGRPDAVLLWIVAFGGVLVALCLASLCVVTTVLALRTSGMTLDRVPAFSWSMLVAGSVWLLSLPVLLGLVILAYVDARYGGGLLGDGSPGFFSSLLRWAFLAPQVFGYSVPALGLLLDAAPVAAKVRSRFHGVGLGAIAAAGVLGYGADMLLQGIDPSITTDFLYVVSAFAIAAPLLIVAGLTVDLLRRGTVRLTSPLLFGIAALLMFLAGAAAGAMRAVEPLHLFGTSADASVVHYALFAGALGAIGAMHHWAPVLFRVELRENAGKAAAGLLLIGTVALALPDLFSGLLDQPTTLAYGNPRDGVELLNAVSLLGGLLVLVGVLVVLANLLSARAASRKGDEPVTDPWDGQTLEWRVAGPLEPVASAQPLLDLKEAAS